MLFTDFKQRLEFSCIFRENVISLAIGGYPHGRIYERGASRLH